MTTVMVSSKFQVVIPKEIRQATELRPSQKLQVVLYEGRVEFIPVGDIRQMRGFLQGIDTTLPRNGDPATR